MILNKAHLIPFRHLCESAMDKGVYNCQTFLSGNSRKWQSQTETLVGSQGPFLADGTILLWE